MVLIALPPFTLEGASFGRDLRRIVASFAGQCFFYTAPDYGA